VDDPDRVLEPAGRGERRQLLLDRRPGAEVRLDVRGDERVAAAQHGPGELGRDKLGGGVEPLPVLDAEGGDGNVREAGPAAPLRLDDAAVEVRRDALGVELPQDPLAAPPVVVPQEPEEFDRGMAGPELAGEGGEEGLEEIDLLGDGSLELPDVGQEVAAEGNDAAGASRRLVEKPVVRVAVAVEVGGEEEFHGAGDSPVTFGLRTRDAPCLSKRATPGRAPGGSSRQP
jgi:hypothetical protein